VGRGLGWVKSKAAPTTANNPGNPGIAGSERATPKKL